MKSFAPILTGFGGMLAGLQWWQVAYRWQLFYRDSGGERYSNHIGNGDFALIHFVNLALPLGGVFAIRTFLREQSGWRWFATGITTANAIAWLMFIYMHSTGVLVEYDEFIRHMRGE